MNKNEIFNIFKSLNLEPTDTILIHSSLKSIGQIEGNALGLIEYLKEFFCNGLIIFPTHTWATIKNDYDIFDKNSTPSCVGALTNIARLQEGFLRSNHPTHSVCAYGIGKEEYIKNDDFAKTPVSPHGCFGVLKEMNAKILFLGAPLSKNTFIHSIEEEFNVEDRFTNHIYHFITKTDNDEIDYFMPRHYSTKSEHISNHYEKLHDILLKNNALVDFKFGLANSYLVDANICHKIVSNLLEENIHIFDDFKEIDI